MLDGDATPRSCTDVPGDVCPVPGSLGTGSCFLPDGTVYATCMFCHRHRPRADLKGMIDGLS